jgi:transposase
MHYIAFDGHKRYTRALVEDEKGRVIREARIDHERGNIRAFLAQWEEGSPVALETIGNWYWIVDEIESAGMTPHLTHARKAKLMMAMVNKSDRLDCRGLNKLQRTGTLPTVWIPPGPVRDARDLPRTRMVFVRERTRLKNRIHATLAKYGVRIEGISDLFGKRGMEVLWSAITILPEQTRFAVEQVIEQLHQVNRQIDAIECQMSQVFKQSPQISLLMSLPGVGFMLAVVIFTEIGDIHRFASAQKLAAYSGTTPRIHQSGESRRYGQVRKDVNRYLKWAYMEAANVICMHRHRHPYLHVSGLYERIRGRKNHQTAIGAVSRHLAEASWWMLKKGEQYREPMRRAKTVSSTKG